MIELLVLLLIGIAAYYYLTENGYVDLPKVGDLYQMLRPLTPVQKFLRASEAVQLKAVGDPGIRELTNAQKWDNLPVGDGSYSIMFFFKNNNDPDGQYKNLVHKGLQNEKRQPGIWLNTNDNITVLSASSNQGQYWGNLPTIDAEKFRYKKGVWNYIAFLVSPTKITIVMNGETQSADMPGGTITDVTQPLYSPDPWHGPNYSGVYMASLMWSPQTVPEGLVKDFATVMAPPA